MALIRKDSGSKDQTPSTEITGATRPPALVSKTSSVDLRKEEESLQLGFSKQKRCDLLYGESGTGKTENIGLGALWVWEKYGKITRLVSADGGGWECIQPYVDLGIIQPLSINSIRSPIKVLMALARGRWPSLIKGKYEYLPLDEKLLEGDEVNGIPGIGCYAFEGLTSFADSVMMDVTYQYEGKTDVSMFPDEMKNCLVTSGNESFKFGGKSSYGFIQTRTQQLVGFMNGLPCEKIICTALENRGTDEFTGEACYGPKIIGQAATGRAPQWFGDCIHLEIVDTKDIIDDDRKDYKKTVEGGLKKKKVRAYLQNHPDPVTGIMYKAKSRASGWVSAIVPPYFDVIINEKERKGLNWLYEQEDIWASQGAEMITKYLTNRPPPVLLYKVRGREMSGGSGNSGGDSVNADITISEAEGERDGE